MYCRHCGEKVRLDVSRCPYCGRDIEESFNFDGVCGLDSTTKASWILYSFFLPLLGLLAGGFYLKYSQRKAKRFGILLLILSVIFWFVRSSVLKF